MLYAFDSPIANPSFTQQSHYPQAHAVFGSVLNTFYYSEGGVVVPVGPLHSLGLSYSGEFSQKIRETVLENGVPVPTGTLVDGSCYALSLSVSRQLLRSFHTGMSYIFVADESIDKKIVHGFDVGLSARTTLGSAGLSLRTMFTSFRTAQRGLSNDLTLTAEPHLPGDIFDVGVTLSIYDPGRNFNDAGSWRAGGRIAMNIPGVASFAFISEFTTRGLASGGVYGVFDFSSLNRNRVFLVGGQYLTILPGEATSYSIYLKRQFGPVRYRDDDLFEQARRFFDNQQFADALVTFGKLLTLYPVYNAVDQVYSYMAHSLFHMGMYKKTVEVCYSGIEQFRKSPVSHQLRLLLLETANRRKDRYSLQSAWKELLAHEPPDSLKFHGVYRYALDLISQGNTDSAYLLLSSIPFDHPDGPYALLSKAQCAATMGRVSEAIGSLEMLSCGGVHSVVTYDALACRAEFIRGLLYLEYRDSLNDGIAQAIASLEKVGEKCSMYGEARAALGWAHFYKQDLAGMLQHARFVLQNGATRMDQIEGGLLFALSAQKESGIALKALDILDTALQQGPSADTLQAELDALKTEMSAAAQSIESMADKLFALSLTARVAWVDTEIKRVLRSYKVKHAQWLKLSDRYTYDYHNFRRDEVTRAWLQAELPYVIAQIISRQK